MPTGNDRDWTNGEIEHHIRQLTAPPYPEPWMILVAIAGGAGLAALMVMLVFYFVT